MFLLREVWSYEFERLNQVSAYQRSKIVQIFKTYLPSAKPSGELNKKKTLSLSRLRGFFLETCIQAALK